MADRYLDKSKEEIYEIIGRAQEGDQAARTLMVIENEGLVKKIACKFAGGFNDCEDLIQIGYIGLIKAIDKFDPTFGVMFSTYAVPMIMGEIKRFLRDDGRIKAGRELKSRVYAFRREMADFMQVNGCSPRISQLAERLGMDEQEVLEIMEADRALGNLTSLETVIREEEQKGYLSENSPEEDLDLCLLKDQVESLPEKQRKIIVLRYYKDMTQTETAKVIGISQVQVSRLEKKALILLRNKIG